MSYSPFSVLRPRTSPVKGSSATNGEGDGASAARACGEHYTLMPQLFTDTDNAAESEVSVHSQLAPTNGQHGETAELTPRTTGRLIGYIDQVPHVDVDSVITPRTTSFLIGAMD
eukprot:TRINITY_DN20206_c0_g2_i1.p1 TRINITY_DN20206_c0_g2~~TRINITY_DN20206_c0_g2_i1.p1  ORF type:complete len:114 (-),score=10.73 TRINITY_DN20206_c0_g2_i1:101-442(-)